MQSRRWSRERDQWVVQGYVVWRTNPQFVPPTDVIELPDKVLVVIEIAGMRPSDFNIALHNRTLVVKGTRERLAMHDAAYYQVEIGYGEFRVEVQLPDNVDSDHVNAVYREGFLHVELPRRTEGQPFIINVNTEERDER